MESKESIIETQILRYLDTLGGYAIKLAPTGYFDTKRKVFRKHTSVFANRKKLDILFYYKGTTWNFEVKTPTEYKYIMKHYAKLSDPVILLNGNKKQVHLHEQIIALDRIRESGNYAFFTYSAMHVKQLFLKEYINESRD